MPLPRVTSGDWRIRVLWKTTRPYLPQQIIGHSREFELNWIRIWHCSIVEWRFLTPLNGHYWRAPEKVDRIIHGRFKCFGSSSSFWEWLSFSCPKEPKAHISGKWNYIWFWSWGCESGLETSWESDISKKAKMTQVYIQFGQGTWVTRAKVTQIFCHFGKMDMIAKSDRCCYHISNIILIQELAFVITVHLNLTDWLLRNIEAWCSYQFVMNIF